MARVVILVDMDCFYAQVEQRERPELWGKPVGVLQYSPNGQSGLIALSYEARAFGVRRGMTAKQSKRLCPEIEICLVPQGEHADKADIQKYRDASAEVFKALGSLEPRKIILERASVDEAFLDVTAYVESRLAEDRRVLLAELRRPGALGTSYVVDGEKVERRLGKEQEYRAEEASQGDDEEYEGEPSQEAEPRRQERKEDERTAAIELFLLQCERDDESLKIALAAEYTERLRARLKATTQFHCSAGVANNKMMAKLVCAAHKPRKQSFVPPDRAKAVIHGTPLRAIRGLGGKFGEQLCGKLNVQTVGDLAIVPDAALHGWFPGHAAWLLDIVEAEDREGVKARTTATSIGVGKNFPGGLAIGCNADARHWMEGLVKELVKRLADDQIKNRRTPQNIVVHVTTDSSTSRTMKTGGIIEEDVRLLDRIWPVFLSLKKRPFRDERWRPPIVNISLCASKFTDGVPDRMASIIGWVERSTKIAIECMEDDARAEAADEVPLPILVDPAKEEIEVMEEEKRDEEEEARAAAAALEEEDDVVCLDDYEEGGGEGTSRGHAGSIVDADGCEFELDEEGWQIWRDPSTSKASNKASVPVASGLGTGTRTADTSKTEAVPGPSTSSSSTEAAPKTLMSKAQLRRRVRPDDPSKRVFSDSNIMKDVFYKLPKEIRQEISHQENLRAAKELKAKQAAKEAAAGIVPKRGRKGKEEKRGGPAKRGKTLDGFFKRPTDPPNR